jgi:hypothetical protein
MITSLVWLAPPLIAGFALPRRYRDGPAAIVIATIAALATAIAAIVIAIPVIGGILAAPDEFIAMHSHDKWAQVYPDGPPEPSHAVPILLSIAIGLVVAVVAWFVVAAAARLGMLLRTLVHHDAPT